MSTHVYEKYHEKSKVLISNTNYQTEWLKIQSISARERVSLINIFNTKSKKEHNFCFRNFISFPHLKSTATTTNTIQIPH